MQNNKYSTRYCFFLSFHQLLRHTDKKLQRRFGTVLNEIGYLDVLFLNTRNIFLNSQKGPIALDWSFK